MCYHFISRITIFVLLSDILSRHKLCRDYTTSSGIQSTDDLLRQTTQLLRTG